MQNNASLLNIVCSGLQYPVEEILLRHDRVVVTGSDVVKKLKGGQVFVQDERVCIVKVLAKYLMEKSTV